MYAQHKNVISNTQSVSNTIKTLFDGMREGDSAKVHTVFHANIKMYTSYQTENGKVMLKEGSLNEFLTAIGTPHELIWDERLSNTIVEIDDNLAQVWTDYSFYLGGEINHCGVDAFQLIKNVQENWKIINLIDTRRIKSCNQIND